MRQMCTDHRSVTRNHQEGKEHKSTDLWTCSVDNVFPLV